VRIWGVFYFLLFLGIKLKVKYAVKHASYGITDVKIG